MLRATEVNGVVYGSEGVDLDHGPEKVCGGAPATSGAPDFPLLMPHSYFQTFTDVGCWAKNVEF